MKMRFDQNTILRKIQHFWDFRNQQFHFNSLFSYVGLNQHPHTPPPSLGNWANLEQPKNKFKFGIIKTSGWCGKYIWWQYKNEESKKRTLNCLNCISAILLRKLASKLSCSTTGFNSFFRRLLQSEVDQFPQPVIKAQ